MEIKIPGVRQLRERIDRGNPLWAATQQPRLTIIMNNLLKAPSSARYSKWDDNQAWSSQEWNTDPPMCDRTGQPVVIPQGGARPQQFIIGNDETELELSVESRSFVNRVNDQVRKRQKRSSTNVTEDGEKHSMIWGMFMSVTMESAVFMGKNCLDNRHSITNTKDLTLKQMFDISTRFVSEQDEISGLETINWLGKAFREILVFDW